MISQLPTTDDTKRKIVMTTASQQIKVPTWKEIIGNALLIEYELKFDVNFSQRKHIYFYNTAWKKMSRCACINSCVRAFKCESFHIL